VDYPAKSPGDKKSIRLSHLGIGDVDLLAGSGEVGTLIDRHLRTELGNGEAMLLTLTNGYSGYIPDDASYARGQTFEVQHSFMPGGCAEQAVVNGEMKLLNAHLDHVRSIIFS
jgi:hypothetical protein